MTRFLRMFFVFCLSVTALAETGTEMNIPYRTAPQGYKVLSHTGAETAGHDIAKAFDGDWLTSWESANAQKPQSVVLDLGTSRDVLGVLYIPPPYSAKGRTAQYSIYLSDDPDVWSEPVAKGMCRRYYSPFWPDVNEQFETILFPKTGKGRYLKWVSHADIEGQGDAAVAELSVITDLHDYPYKNTTFGQLKGQRMAPSIHLNYNLPPARLFHMEMTPEVSVPGSYFMAAGFTGGYYGMQEQSNGHKVVLFSLWDSAATDNPAAVHADEQVRVLYQDPQMRVRRFGGEGVGVQSFLDYDWKLGQPYRFVVKIDHHLLPDWTAFSAYFFTETDSTWRKLMTLAVKHKNLPLTGQHSFVEDFKRDFKSFTQKRGASFSKVWALSADSQWIQSEKAFFTADGNPNRNIDAGPRPDGGFMVTGGNAADSGKRLWKNFKMGQSVNTPPVLPDEVVKEALPDDARLEDVEDED